MMQELIFFLCAYFTNPQSEIFFNTFTNTFDLIGIMGEEETTRLINRRLECTTNQ